MKYTITAALALILTCCIFYTVGFTTAEPAVSAPAVKSEPTFRDENRESPITRFAVVGDSISACVTGHLETKAELTADCWVSVADADPLLSYAGGWAQSGSLSTEQAVMAYPVNADVLVMMNGTNDYLKLGEPRYHTQTLDEIAAKVGAPRVVLMALPPLDYVDFSTPVSGHNAYLAEHAAAMGWTFIDPWGEFRAGEEWAPGTSKDGVHPNEAAHQRAGEIISETLRSIK